MNSDLSFRTRALFKYAFGLFTAISTYNLLYVHFWVNHLPVAGTFIMFFLPLFCYMLQQSIYNRALHPVPWYIFIVYSMIMIWVVAVVLGLARYLAIITEQEWFFGKGAREIPSTSLLIIIKRQLIGYTIFGVPSAFLAQLVLYIKNKTNR